MKKFTILFASMLVCALPVMAQAFEEDDEESVDSIVLANDTVQEQAAESEGFAGGDVINLESYAPNRFADNWEISLAGGVTILFNGLGARETTSNPNYDATGGIAEISATKWFNPYVGARFAWTTGYLPFKQLKAEPSSDNWRNCPWHNYVHIDMLWDWTSQFGGYKPDRVYDAVPYVHAGIVGNPRNTIMVGGGVGLLNRFHLSDKWLLHLDVRATATSASKFGVVHGVAMDVDALIGVTYRFDQTTWKTTVPNPYKATLDELQAAYDELARERAKAEAENAKLGDSMTQREQERNELAKLVSSMSNAEFGGIPDTMKLTIYYPINSSELSMYEKAHMNTYLRLISLNDPNSVHKYKVIGTADASTGAREVNERLCQRRADAIKDVLVKNGVNPANITTEIEIVEGGNAQLSRASHVIIYPVK